MQSATTPMLGIVVKPWDRVSLHANRIEGLRKGDTAPTSAVNAGEVFAPYKARQHELGVKMDHGRFMTTISLFQIAKPSGVLVNNVYAVDGKQRNRGLELSLHGAPLPGWRVHGGLTWVDAKLVRTGNPATQGNFAAGAPPRSGPWCAT
ncbi:MAG: TonB-dependent receptor [Burkholderiaceae bacterium]